MSKVPAEKRGRGSSLYFLAANLGWFFAFALGGLLPKRVLLPSALVLLALGIVMLTEKGKVKKEGPKKRGKKVTFVPPLAALVLSGIALGFMTLLVNTEVAIAVFGKEFGKAWGGLLLAFAALFGSAISYFFNKKLIDVMESHLSILLPGALTSSASFLISLPAPFSALGLFATKALVAWWRSSLLGLARVGDVGRRVGAFNSAGDGGRLLGSLIASAGPWTLPVLSALSLALALSSWLLSLRSPSTSPPRGGRGGASPSGG
jgi:MFS family permease